MDDGSDIVEAEPAQGSFPQSGTDRLQAALQEFWGYQTFRPLQQEAMESVLSGRDTLVVMPTGGGKSLCYQAPALCLPGTAVIVSPLISLMKDQVDAAQACGIAANVINSVQTSFERRAVLDDLRSGSVKLLYVSPERLVQSDFLDALSKIAVPYFAIDEAHCVSQWGHDFRPQYRELRVLRERFPDAGVHAFTATATERVRLDVAEQLGLRDPAIFVGGFDRPNLVYRVARKNRLAVQIMEAVARHAGESGIIYCITRKDADEWAERLQQAGVRARPYHAGLTDDDRQRNQQEFIDDKVDVIVATVAFGMGVDKSNVRFVIHAGMPQSIEHYQQESGRAGRDGLEAECLLFYGGDDFRKWQFILDRQPDAVRTESLASLKGISEFCDGALCRHRSLVRHFGQDLDEDCGNACDLCLGGHEEMDDPLVIGQKILSSVYRQQQRFGAEYTALVLKGSRSARVIQNNHDQLSTFGLLKDDDKTAILGWIGQLTQQGFLERTGEFDVLRITEQGRRLLAGEVVPRLLKSTRPGREKEPAKAKTKRVATVSDAAWEGVDRDLFAALRTERTDMAAERGVPPYLIFSDATLRDLARLQPLTESALLEVYGIGAKKLEDFGRRILNVVKAHCENPE